MKRRVLRIASAWICLGFVAESAVRLIACCGDGAPPCVDASLRNEWSWVRARLADGDAELWPGVVFDLRTGWKNTPGIATDTLRTNSAGMRSEHEFSHEKPEDRRRMLLLGDSYTFGHGLPDEATFAHLLETAYLPPEWELLNTAVPGYGTDQQLIAFEAEGRLYDPDIVILGFYLRDYSRNVLSFRDYAKPMFVLEPSGLRLTHSPILSPDLLLDAYSNGRRSIGDWSYSYALQALILPVAKLRARRIRETSHGWRVLSKLMERFARVVRESGAHPVWMIIPTRDQVSGEPSRFASLTSLCTAKAATLALDCIELEGPFRAQELSDPAKPIYRPRDQGGHLSVTGNRIAAQSIFEQLVAFGLFE